MIKDIYLKLEKINKYKFGPISFLRIMELTKGHKPELLNQAMELLPTKKVEDSIEEFRKCISKVISQKIKDGLKTIEKQL